MTGGGEEGEGPRSRKGDGVASGEGAVVGARGTREDPRDATDDAARGHRAVGLVKKEVGKTFDPEKTKIVAGSE